MILRMPPIGFVVPLVTAAATGVSLVPGARTVAPLPDVSVSTNVALANALSLPAFSNAVTAGAAFSDRPLLAENRQNPEMPMAEPIEPMEILDQTIVVDIQPATPPMPPMIKMTGHMRVKGQTRVLLQNVEDGSEVWATLGDRIDAWTLVEITQDSVELSMGAEVFTIKLLE